MLDTGEEVSLLTTADEIASIIIARRGPWTDAWTLQKLLYYVQAWHLAVTDEPLFDDRIKAWKDGPVVPAVWHSRHDQASRRAIAQSPRIELDDLSSNLIDVVLATYGQMSGDELRALTHVEEPWREARGDLPEDAPCREEIDRETMARFYRTSRMLGGRTASDLASVGIHLRTHRSSEPVDVDALLADLEEDDPGEDPWGGANLGGEHGEGQESEARRAYAGV